LAASSPSQFVKPKDLADSTEYSGDEVEQREQRVLSKEEGGCPGRSRRLSLASSLSSLTTSVSPKDEEASEDEDGDPMAGVEMKKSSLDSAEEDSEEDGDLMIVTEEKFGNSLEEEEEGDPKIVAEEKSSGNSSEEEEEGDPKIVAEEKSSEKLEDALQKSFEAMEDEIGEPMAGIELNNLPLGSLDGRVGDTMNIDEDLSVQLAATCELRRSSRNPPMKNKPSSPKETKSKGKQTMRKVLLHVSLQMFKCHKANSMLFRMTLRMESLSSWMLGRQQFVFAFLNMILN
jgi:hypothetical protein